jgi:hypothetical protein
VERRVGVCGIRIKTLPDHEHSFPMRIAARAEDLNVCGN